MSRDAKIVAWMLAHRSNLRAARSGRAAAARPGRWNAARTRAIYAYPSVAIPALHTVALMGSIDALADFRACRVHFSRDLLTRPTKTMLPTDPGAPDAVEECRATGSFWFGAKVSPVMAVPSPTLPGEEIYVIDPTHPQFYRVGFSGWFLPPLLARPRRVPARVPPAAGEPGRAELAMPGWGPPP